jgi:hypothetical protein
MSVRTTDYLSPAEFSERSGLSLATVYRRLRDRSLPSAQPGGPRTRVLIPVDALGTKAVPPEILEAPSPPIERTITNPTTPPPLPGPAPKWRRSVGGR